MKTTTQTDSLGRPLDYEARRARRIKTARYVVLAGPAGYLMSWGIYDDAWPEERWEPDHTGRRHGPRQWNPAATDTLDIDLGIHGIATLEEAIRECDLARDLGAVGPFVVKVRPIRGPRDLRPVYPH
jgi:hypothetical protein